MIETKPAWQFERLCALWVLAESGLGGWMHSLKVPLTGILLGGASVVVLCLLAWNAPNPGRRLLQATLLVASFKLLISPQAPIQAYFALFFQGICGVLFFSVLPSYRLACWLTGFIALAESGAQKFLVASLWMGEDFWKALNKLAGYVGKFLAISPESASWMPAGLVLGWTLFHAFWGLFIAVWISRWVTSPAQSVDWNSIDPQVWKGIQLQPTTSGNKNRNRWLKWAIWLSPLLLTAWLSEQPLALLGRLIALPAIGLLVIFPLFKAWLKHYGHQHQAPMNRIEMRLNELRLEWPLAWHLSGVLAEGKGRSFRMRLLLQFLLQEEGMPEWRHFLQQKHRT